MSMEERRDGAPEEKSKISPALIIGLIVAALIIIFIIQNSKQANVHVLFWNGQWSIWIVIVISVALGVVLDRAIIWYMRRRRANAG
jgi:uncharacterized integral membrane protein